MFIFLKTALKKYLLSYNYLLFKFLEMKHKMISIARKIIKINKGILLFISLWDIIEQINLTRPENIKKIEKPILKPSAVFNWYIKYNKPVESAILKSEKYILYVE